MSRHITFKVDDKEYRIDALTCGQLEELQVASMPETPSQNLRAGSREWWAQTRAIILAALAVTHPEIDEAAVRNMPFGTLDEVVKIREDILIFAGIIDAQVLKAAKQQIADRLAKGEPIGDLQPGGGQAAAA